MTCKSYCFLCRAIDLYKCVVLNALLGLAWAICLASQKLMFVCWCKFHLLAICNSDPIKFKYGSLILLTIKLINKAPISNSRTQQLITFKNGNSKICCWFVMCHGSHEEFTTPMVRSSWIRVDKDCKINQRSHVSAKSITILYIALTIKIPEGEYQLDLVSCKNSWITMSKAMHQLHYWYYTKNFWNYGNRSAHGKLFSSRKDFISSPLLLQHICKVFEQLTLGIWNWGFFMFSLGRKILIPIW